MYKPPPTESCRWCNGKGITWSWFDHRYVSCWFCKGTGTVVVLFPTPAQAPTEKRP